MNQIKITLLTIAVLLCSISARANYFELDGISYYITSEQDLTVSVTRESRWHRYSGSVNIPSSVEYNGRVYSVTGIFSNVFEYCTELTSITIPSSVTNIGEYAFQGCTSLTSITIPSSVTIIKGYAFQGCTGLISITIPSSVTIIGEYAFRGCTSLTSIVIPNSMTEIGNNAFRGCTSLTSIVIPNSVTTIAYDAFRDCTSLTNITIPNSVEKLGSGAFSGCTSLPVEGNIRYADTWAVGVTDKTLAKYTLRENTTGLAAGLFINCNIMEISIPKSVMNIIQRTKFI